MKHIDWKLQHCLHKPIGWIEEKTKKLENKEWKNKRDSLEKGRENDSE